MLQFSCQHCETLDQVWHDLAETFSKTDDVIIAKADCSNDPEICSGRTMILVGNVNRLCFSSNTI